MQTQGFVSLVGAGPGDPDLLTLKAHRLLQQADVVLFDRLVSKAILDLIPTGISRIAVGKSAGNHCVPQDQINEILINLARAGHRIVRLKGGDPYLFGRGSEEALELKAQNIPFEVVPGITAAAGCSAYSGIPLTHRGKSRRVQFLTGHFKNDEPLDVDWNSVADPHSTLVIYMGLSSLEEICQQLIRAGLPSDFPAAAIENGTTVDQRCVISTLAALSVDVMKYNLGTPVMLIIGEVVSLAGQLDWFGEWQQQMIAEANHEAVALVR